MKKYKFCSLFLLFIFNGFCFSQTKTARQVADEAVKKGSPENVINYVQSEIQKITVLSEKRSLYIFLGTLQETFSKFQEASISYAKAAGISASNSEKMIKKTNEELVLDAVRCSLSWGDFNTANSYLNSQVRNSTNQEILAKIKLFEQWSILCQAENVENLREPIEMLKVYKNLDSCKSVKPSILLTLWYLTDNKDYAVELQKEFPKSMETGIVTGKISILPAPFWYFTPKSENKQNQNIIEENVETEEKNISENVNSKPDENIKEEIIENSSKNDEIKLQLGLFRDKNNAQKFADSVKEKGFDAYIIEEKRSSGNVYFAVIVNQNGDSELSIKLKTAGFENYQYSE